MGVYNVRIEPILFFTLLALANPAWAVLQATEDGKYPQVVLLAPMIHSDSADITTEFCTGTLVGPRAVMTAAHCASAEDRMAAVIGNEAYFGTFWKSPEYRRKGDWDHDLAILELDRPVASIKPWSIYFHSPLKADWISFAGYGKSQSMPPDMLELLSIDSGLGTQRIGRTRISEVTTNLFHVGPMSNRFSLPFFGDSGGPVFEVENGEYRVFGVVSNVMFTGIYPTGGTFTLSSAPENREFIETIAQSKGLEIAGVKAQADLRSTSVPLRDTPTCLGKALSIGWSPFFSMLICVSAMDLPDDGRIDCILKKVNEGKTQAVAGSQCLHLDRR